MKQFVLQKTHRKFKNSKCPSQPKKITNKIIYCNLKNSFYMQISQSIITQHVYIELVTVQQQNKVLILKVKERVNMILKN